MTPVAPILAAVDMFGRTGGRFASGKIVEAELDSVLLAPMEQERHRHFDLGLVEQRQTFAPVFVVKDNNRPVVALVADVELTFDSELAVLLEKMLEFAEEPRQHNQRMQTTDMHDSADYHN